MERFTPELESPYPDTDWNDITHFEYVTPLWLYRDIEAVKIRRDEDALYVVGQDYKVSYALDGGDPKTLTVPKGLLTDLSSVPRIARPIIARVGPHLEASIIHDFLYVAWQDLGDRGARRRDQVFADKLMRAAMRDANVDTTDRILIYRSLKLAGWPVYQDPNPPPRYVKI
jgi:hypothetical protein